MEEKTVTLNIVSAEMLEEYRELHIEYEELMKEVHDIDTYHPEDDEALIRVALGRAIDDIKDSVDEMKRMKEAKVAP